MNIHNDSNTLGNEFITIGPRRVGKGSPTFIVAEIGQAHDGSLGMAHAYIDAVAEAGADAIKFQTHIAGEESTLDEPFRIKFSKQDDTRYAYWKRMEFSTEQWEGIAEHCLEKGLVFLSSPFSVRAVEILREIGMPAWKIGSGEVRSKDLFNAMALNNSPILLSTGMSDWEEITGTVEHVKGKGLKLAVFQCTSKYPTRLEEVGLNLLDEFRERFGCPVGLSDHSGSLYPGLAALSGKADILEVHVTFDKRLFGPDVIASLTVDELRFLINANNAFQKMINNPVDKDDMAENLSDMRSLFNKSVSASRPLSKGTVLSKDMLTLKKPGTGIPSKEIESIVGRRLIHDITPDRILKWDDLE